ncbi:glyoxylase I family protein [Pontibacter ummariensis]|uniref:Glyoxylase I family protein n=1 Tax=Pontibacter ummariensis TaxID=1610492 RepID=A0A239D9H2_9BACT|nr:VOC family protein [Pontibacter ummariensis]PRY14297.1 glyoxylase I family protein [Pontibacter ummariensis]SNS28511.1 glyoxylase I family protein [Pontibacter ummariensis]
METLEKKGIGIKTAGIHHMALRCSDMGRTKRFYQDVLGFQVVLDTPDLFGVMVGPVFVGFRPAELKETDGKVFNPFQIGLDHVAMACESEEELKRVAAALATAGVENTGVKRDPTLNKNYVAFKDPDRIQWELYMS